MSDIFSHKHPYEQTKETIGSMMFRAQVYIQLALAGKHGNELVTESTRFIEAYDFQSAFEHILGTKQAPNKGINEDDPYENCFYRVLGDICLSRAERDVGTFIRRLVNPYVSAQPQPDAADVHNQWMKEEVTLQHDGQDDYQQLPRYTSALYEYGQERGGRPRKETKQLTIDAIEFQAILVFGKHRGSGIGRSKKIAGHLAAKDLCQQLGIHL